MQSFFGNGGHSASRSVGFGMEQQIVKIIPLVFKMLV